MCTCSVVQVLHAACSCACVFKTEDEPVCTQCGVVIGVSRLCSGEKCSHPSVSVLLCALHIWQFCTWIPEKWVTQKPKQDGLSREAEPEIAGEKAAPPRCAEEEVRLPQNEEEREIPEPDVPSDNDAAHWEYWRKAEYSFSNHISLIGEQGSCEFAFKHQLARKIMCDHTAYIAILISPWSVSFSFFCFVFFLLKETKSSHVWFFFRCTSATACMFRMACTTVWWPARRTAAS